MQQYWLNNLWRLIFIGLLGLIVSSGCAFRSLIYSNLEWLILYQVDDYLDLKSTQKQQLKIPIHETLAWFKAERLPQLITLLKEIQGLAKQAKLDAADLNRPFKTIADWRVETTRRLAAPVGLLLKNLDEDQRNHLAARMAKEDASLEKLLQYGEDKFPEKLEDYLEEKAKSLNFWFGKLEPHQLRLMGVELGFNRPFLTAQLRQKQRIREYWLSAIKTQDLNGLIQTVIESSLSDGGWRDEEYQAYRQLSKDRWQNFIKKLLQSLDANQWQHLEKTLAELIGEMEAFRLKN